jgi:hypothetical protein
MVMYNQMWVYQSTMTNCNKAKSLADWLYWTQTDSEALDAATTNYVLPLSSVDRFNKTILTRIASMTCNGATVSSVAGCVYQGMVCADAGTCVNSKCVCNSDREGEYCQTAVRTPAFARAVTALLRSHDPPCHHDQVSSSDSLSTGAILGIVLGVSIPGVLILVCLIVLVAVAISTFAARVRCNDDNRPIPPLCASGGAWADLNAIVALLTVAEAHEGRLGDRLQRTGDGRAARHGRIRRGQQGHVEGYRGCSQDDGLRQRHQGHGAGLPR